ncbi:MAG: hypothetical protein JRC89_09765 [Deltaproteobacteria bacterium]|nr:hypothetical protein [Deltaproteobacteria bacterium]MBW2643633.1 hypothetical protein [Deltaproteobacteria bacterium]
MDEKDVFEGSHKYLLNKSRRIKNSAAKTSPNTEAVIQKGFILLNDMGIIFSV